MHSPDELKNFTNQTHLIHSFSLAILYFSVLRQAAVKTFKKEISTLKTHVHQVSMERDKLKSSLSRTMEEKAYVIKEGDENVESIMRNADRNIK